MMRSFNLSQSWNWKCPECRTRLQKVCFCAKKYCRSNQLALARISDANNTFSTLQYDRSVSLHTGMFCNFISP